MIPIGWGRRKFPTQEIYINVCFVLVQDFETGKTRNTGKPREIRDTGTLVIEVRPTVICVAQP